MGFLQGLLADLVIKGAKMLMSWAGKWLAYGQRVSKAKKENKKAVEKVKNSKTNEEIDDALISLKRRMPSKPVKRKL